MGGGGGNFPTYAQLMTATDASGTARGYLASEEQFAFIRGLHSRNLIVPIVGDFAGTKALRTVGQYPEGARHDGIGLLPFQRRTVPGS